MPIDEIKLNLYSKQRDGSIQLNKITLELCYKYKYYTIAVNNCNSLYFKSDDIPAFIPFRVQNCIRAYFDGYDFPLLDHDYSGYLISNTLFNKAYSLECTWQSYVSTCLLKKTAPKFSVSSQFDRSPKLRTSKPDKNGLSFVYESELTAQDYNKPQLFGWTVLKDNKILCLMVSGSINRMLDSITTTIETKNGQTGELVINLSHRYQCGIMRSIDKESQLLFNHEGLLSLDSMFFNKCTSETFKTDIFSSLGINIEILKQISKYLKSYFNNTAVKYGKNNYPIMNLTPAINNDQVFVYESRLNDRNIYKRTHGWTSVSDAKALFTEIDYLHMYKIAIEVPILALLVKYVQINGIARIALDYCY